MLNLEEILKKHKLWIDGKKGGERANLSDANLRGADLSRADLSRANLSCTDLRGADLGDVDLRGADLSRANLSSANLSRASLSRANLSRANLSRANLSRADLRGADLDDADLGDADLRGADLRGADLSRANLSCTDLSRASLSRASLSRADLRGADLDDANLGSANLSGAKNLLKTIDYLEANFDRTEDGYIVYKTFSKHYTSPENWAIKENSIIEENCNSNRTDTCGCGINVATLDWVKKDQPNAKEIWKLLIKWEWMAGVVVPYNTDGKIRCEKAMILEKIEM